MKRVLMSIFVLGIIIISLGFVSAGFWDLFSRGGDEGDGELASEGVDIGVTVSGSGSPPEIVFISDINGYENIGDVPGADRDLTSGTTTTKEFEFFVYSGGGVDALPTGIDVNDVNALITLRDKNAPNDERKSSDSGGVSCVHDRDAAAPVGSVAHAGEQTRVYVCSAPMQYYDDFASALSPNWDVKAMIKDVFDQEDSDTTPNSVGQPTRETFFNILRAFELGPVTAPSLDYGTVSYGTGLDREPSTNYPLQIKDIGNADVDVTSLKSYKIPGDTTASEYIPVEWFSIAPDIACGAGTNLVDETYTDTGLPNIIHGDSVSDELKICLNQIQTSHAGGYVSQQSYSTTNILQGEAAAKPWEIDVTYVQ